MNDFRYGAVPRGDEASEEKSLGVHYATFRTFNLNQGAGNELEQCLTPGQPRRSIVAVQRQWR